MEIRIGKPTHRCTGCDSAFSHEEELHSLVKLEERSLVREDYCPACWRPERAQAAYSTWACVFIDPKVAEQEPPEAYSPLRQVFFEAVAAEDRLELAKAYLAAQLLRRQKVFRLIKESDEGEGEVRISLFSDRIGDRLIEVRDPSLTYDEMEGGRRALMERLAMLEEEAAPAAVGAQDAPNEQE